MTLMKNTLKRLSIAFTNCKWLCGFIIGEHQTFEGSLLLALSITTPAPIAQLVECPLRGTGGHGFDPGPRHTKVVKNGTNCSSLGTQIYGVELGLVDPVSG